MISTRNDNIGMETPQDETVRQKPARSSNFVQLIFAGTLLFIVLSVIVEYVLGDFIGLNPGQDLGLVLAGTLTSGICVGVVAGLLHDWSERAKHR